MSVWHIPWHVIENEWTDRQFFMFMRRCKERLEKQAGGVAPQPRVPERAAAFLSGRDIHWGDYHTVMDSLVTQ